MVNIVKRALAKAVLNIQNSVFCQKYRVIRGVGKKSEHEKSGGMRSSIEYDVFLSFRGPDTRQGFTNRLYNNLLDADIRVFLDKELHVGIEIDDGLRTAIERSRIYIPIFSRGYASSDSCLFELENMVECWKLKPLEKEIFPIFYDVEPRDVELQSQLYVGALAKHEEKFCRQTIGSWEDALKTVAQINGWELKNQGHWMCIKSVTEEILKKLKEQDK